MNIPCRFRTQANRKQWSIIMDQYTSRGKLLFTRAGGRAGNSFSAVFWAGYDGLTYGPRVAPAGSPSYVFRRAGQEIRRAEEAMS